MNGDELKNIVREKYSAIAQQTKQQNETSCCGGTGSCKDVDYTIFSDNYEHLEGYNADADLGLGCGIPTEFAQLKPGDVVVDLGSGAGNDCFVARSIVGETGRVIGVDFTPAMLTKARANAQKLNYTNVEFRLGDIEKMPITANKADVIISNCVLNLVPDKAQAFKEINRVLKPGGHLSVSDVVIRGELPPEIQNAAEMYAGCVSGAIQYDDYLAKIEEAGLQNIKVQKEKQIVIPDEIMLGFLSPEQLEAFKQKGIGIYSITVYAEKKAGCGCNCNC